MYGDFLFDVAWLSFWSDSIPYADIFKNHYSENDVEIESFDQRVRCYQLKLGLGALSFFAGSEQRGSYEWTRDKLLDLAKRG